MNLEQFIDHEAPQKDLLAEVLAIQKASLAGEYYEEPAIKARAFEENTRGTLCWIADVCRAFEILPGLLDSLDDETGGGIFFAREGGSGMAGVD